jgi:hypothetical protein
MYGALTTNWYRHAEILFPKPPNADTLDVLLIEMFRTIIWFKYRFLCAIIGLAIMFIALFI